MSRFNPRSKGGGFRLVREQGFYTMPVCAETANDSMEYADDESPVRAPLAEKEEDLLQGEGGGGGAHNCPVDDQPSDKQCGSDDNVEAGGENEAFHRDASLKLNIIGDAKIGGVNSHKEGKKHPCWTKLLKKKSAYKVLMMLLTIGLISGLMYLATMHTSHDEAAMDVVENATAAASAIISDAEMEAEFEVIYENYDDAALDEALRHFHYDYLQEPTSEHDFSTRMPRVKLMQFLNLSERIRELRNLTGNVTLDQPKDAPSNINKSLLKGAPEDNEMFRNFDTYNTDKLPTMLSSYRRDLLSAQQTNDSSSNDSSVTPNLHRLHVLLLRVNIMRNRYLWLRQREDEVSTQKLVAFTSRYVNKINKLILAFQEVFGDQRKFSKVH